MAIAYTRVASYSDNNQTIIDVTLDGSYASGGYLLDARQMGVLNIDDIQASVVTGEGFIPTYVASTGKLKLAKSAAGATAFTECAAGDLTSSIKVRCSVTGHPIL